MCHRGCCDRVRCGAERPAYRNRTLRCSQGRCPSSRRCHSRGTRIQGLRSPASTFPATDHSHEPRRYHWLRAELLQRRQRNPCQLRLLQLGSCGRERHSSQPRRESERFAAEKSSDSIAVAPWFTFAVTRCTLRLRPNPARVLFGDLSLNGHLAHCVLFTPRACIRHGKLVVARGIRRQHLHVAFERGNGFRKAFGRIQGHAQGEIGFGKTRIQLGRIREVRNCLIPLSHAARKLPEPEFGGSVVWIDLEFLLKFFSGLLCVRWRLRL